MSVRVFFVLVSFVFITGHTNAQYMLNSDGGMIFLKPSGDHIGDAFRRGTYAGEHVLGEEVSIALDKFEKKYVYYKPGTGAYAVDEKVVVKPVLYKKIKRIERYITKEYQKNKIQKNDAEERIVGLLNVGVRLLEFDTVDLEMSLNLKNEPKDIEEILMRIRFE